VAAEESALGAAAASRSEQPHILDPCRAAASAARHQILCDIGRELPLEATQQEAERKSHTMTSIGAPLHSSKRRREPTPKSPCRLEAIVRRQRHGRRRDLLFACSVALAVLGGASTAGVHVLSASAQAASSP
jgi:hypothetical protein